jgi:hypothetical protein
MSVPYASQVKSVQTGRAQYNNPMLETRWSMPVKLAHFGWPNPYKIPYRKSHTAGQITGELLEFPEGMFPRGERLNPKNISTQAMWTRGYGELR